MKSNVSIRTIALFLQQLISGAIALANAVLTNPTITGGVSSAKPLEVVLTADGAVTIQESIVSIKKTSAAALTLAAPTTAQDGTVITFLGVTAYAHVITFTGGAYVTGTSSTKTTATFPAYEGGTLRVIAKNGHWYQSGLTAVTLA